MKAPLAGGTATSLAPGGDYGSLALDATTVYFTDPNHGTLYKVSKNGGTLTTLATGQPGIHAVAVDAACVYWINGGTAAANYADGSLMTMLK
jgi:hypothetical protein